jgi:hypothetical protein
LRLIVKSFNNGFLPAANKHQGQESKQNFKEPVLANVNTLQIGVHLSTLDDMFLILPPRDLSGNPLVCDCELRWLLEWAQNVSVKLTSSPKCGGPPALRGQPIRKLQVDTDLHCNWTSAGSRSGTLLELKPSHSQV